MTLYVALLRGINVNPSMRVAMADLRDILTGLGYSNVRTLLNSGNAVVKGGKESSVEQAERIQSALGTRLGIHVRVIVKPAYAFNLIVAENPLLDIAANPSRLIVTFTQEPSGLAPLKNLAREDWSPEALVLGRFAAYMWCPDGTIASRVAQQVGKALGERGTTRNWATVLKLSNMLQDAG
jgi:uncharacterized protein (DUF1697 family)